MKRLATIAALVFCCLLAFGQEKVSVDSEFPHEVYARNIGTPDNPVLSVIFMPEPCQHWPDSVAFILDSDDCKAMALFFRDLHTELKQKASVVKKNKILDYERTMDTEPPSVRSELSLLMEDQYGRTHRETFSLPRSTYIQPVFRVRSGRCFIDLNYRMCVDGRPDLEVSSSFLLFDYSLNKYARKLDYRQLVHRYRKAHPARPSKDEVDALFDGMAAKKGR